MAAKNNKKYEILDETIIHNGVTLHRIRALKDIEWYEVAAGDLGGFIESENNLSGTGRSWVGGNAKVYGNARVYENAIVSDNAEVFGNAEIRNYGSVYDNAKVYGDAYITGYAEISEEAKVYGVCMLAGWVEVRGTAEVQWGKLQGEFSIDGTPIAKCAYRC